MTPEELKARTKLFALDIIKLVEYINKNCSIAAQVIANRQLLRSGTGVFANYRAACRAKSAKDFINKLGIIIEEADETMFWLEILVEANLVEESLIKDLYQEATELTAIMVASKRSASKNFHGK